MPHIHATHILGNGPSRLALLDELEHVLEQLQWTMPDSFAVRLAVEEAVANAFHHGNQEGTLGSVQLRWFASSHEFWMEVRDQGMGFDDRSIPDPTAPENIEKTTGRGILLMRKCMSEVTFSDGGRTVFMRKDPKPK